MQVVKKWLAESTTRQLFFLLTVGLLLRIVIAIWLPPGFDETYYYVYTQHLDWSYFDHPPLVALTTGFGPWLTGEVTQFTIRLGTVILHTGTLVLLYLTSAKLFSTQAAILTLALATAIPLFQVAFGIFTLPDSPLMFFWSATLYWAAHEFFNRPGVYRPSYRLMVISVLVGLACLGKYHGFVLGLGLIGFCVSSPRHRSALMSPWAWVGLGLFLVTISPVLLWNWQHQWVSFRFQSLRAVPSRGYKLSGLLGTFLVGVGYLFPTFGLPLWWILLRTVIEQIAQPLSRKSLLESGDFRQKQLFLLWASLPLILGFTFLGGYKQILPSWPMPGFWGATLLLGQRAALWQQQSSRWVRHWLWGSGIVTSTILLIALLHLTTGTLQTKGQYSLFGGFLPVAADPSTQMLDLQQIRRAFIESPILRDALQDSGFIFTKSYYLSGQIAMALAPLSDKPVTCFDWDLRGFAFWSRAEQWVGKNALYVTSEYFQQGRPDPAVRYGPYFSTMQKIGDIPIRRGGAVVQVFKVYEAKNLLGPYPRLY